MAAAKRLDADYQKAWGEYEHAMLREDDDAAERDEAALKKHTHLEAAAARENARRLKVLPTHNLLTQGAPHL